MASIDADKLDQSVAGVLRRDYTLLKVDQTVEEALASLRGQKLGERIVYLYVVDAEEKLRGVMPTRRLLMAQLHEKVADLMVRRVVALPLVATVLEACEFFVQYKLLAFPVIDDDGRLVGVLDAYLFTDRVFHAAERRSAADVFQLIGVHVRQRQKFSPWLEFRSRFPWLACNIVAGVLCALLAGYFENLLDQVIVLALFIPVVLTLSEAVSTQSMTLTLQWLHDAELTTALLVRSLLRELASAALLGAASGLCVGAAAWLWKGDLQVGAVIAISITLAMTTACGLGVLLPVAVRALRVDPKIAAGPIVLATADVITLLLYFNWAGWLLR